METDALVIFYGLVLLVFALGFATGWLCRTLDTADWGEPEPKQDPHADGLDDIPAFLRKQAD